MWFPTDECDLVVDNVVSSARNVIWEAQNVTYCGREIAISAVQALDKYEPLQLPVHSNLLQNLCILTDYFTLNRLSSMHKRAIREVIIELCRQGITDQPQRRIL